MPTKLEPGSGILLQIVQIARFDPFNMKLVEIQDAGLPENMIIRD